ncbi:MAG: hypothetical protein ACUVRL_07600 [Candidatus Saccharicenans sp.]
MKNAFLTGIATTSTYTIPLPEPVSSTRTAAASLPLTDRAFTPVQTGCSPGRANFGKI